MDFFSLKITLDERIDMHNLNLILFRFTFAINCITM